MSTKTIKDTENTSRYLPKNRQTDDFFWLALRLPNGLRRMNPGRAYLKH